MERRLILYMSASLDGFAQRRDGGMDWLGDEQRFGEHRQAAAVELIGQAGVLVLGRRAAQDMAQAWPGSTSPIGTLMNELPKLVFSSSITDLDWANTRVSNRPVEEEVAALKDEPGKDLVVLGGASIVRSLAAHELIDEYRINVQPIALGDGSPLLAGLPEARALTLVASTTWADGPIMHTYVPRRKA